MVISVRTMLRFEVGNGAMICEEAAITVETSPELMVVYCDTTLASWTVVAESLR